jgi:hypothetical protein
MVQLAVRSHASVGLGVSKGTSLAAPPKRL